VAIEVALGDLAAHGITTFDNAGQGGAKQWRMVDSWSSIIKKFEYMDLTAVPEEQEPLPDEVSILGESGL
jgi:hypothetical protein